MSRQAAHLARVRAILQTFANEVTPAEAVIALEDAEVAIRAGIPLGLTIEQIKRGAAEAITDIINTPEHRRNPERN